jgi:two-component system sensor histidine kinase PilS (NtrC family)
MDPLLAERLLPASSTRAERDHLLAQRLRWLIALRIVVITSALVPFFFLQLSTEEIQRSDFTFLYLLAGGTYGISLLYITLLRLPLGWVRSQAYFQFCGDLLLTTGLVYYFGGPFTPFSILYLVVIIVASSLLKRRAGVVTATLAWLLYSTVGIALFVGAIESPLGGVEPGSVWRLSYNLGIHFFGFYAVALMTSRLSDTVSLTARELQEQRENLADLKVVHRDVIESIPSGLITTDRNARITSVNRAAETILGRQEANLIGRPIDATRLVSEESWRTLSELAPEQRQRREVEYKVEDEVRQVGFALSSLTTADGSPRGHILIFQDLSNWKKLQDELQLKDRMAAIGELAAGIAHEIGNPLAAISGSCQMLSNTFKGTQSQRKLLEILLKESQRLDRTIKGFLKFAKPNERSVQRFDIAALLAENMELLRNSAEVSERHELELELSPPSQPILADPDQVSQIFWNVARNALRAMPDGGTLRLATDLSNEVYRMRFIDDGCGMTEEERANLFHPFSSTFDGGAGIGMAIVYQIVQEHSGRLILDSQPNAGSVITVELPAEEAITSELRLAEA